MFTFYIKNFENNLIFNTSQGLSLSQNYMYTRKYLRFFLKTTNQVQKQNETNTNKHFENKYLIKNCLAARLSIFRTM